jgi:hypothetical protein
MAAVKLNVPPLVFGYFAGFAGIKMILAGGSGQQFAGFRFFYAFGGSLVGFDFRHIC